MGDRHVLPDTDWREVITLPYPDPTICETVMRRLRLGLVVACLAAAVPVAWRVGDVIAETDRSRLGAVTFQRGVALLDAGRHDEAGEAFRVTIAYAPKNPEAYQRLAEAEFKRGRIDEAVAAYRKLLAIYPFTYFPLLYWQLALIEINTGRLTEAREDLLQAVALDPSEWRPYYFLGIVYGRLGDISSARAAWRRVLALDPENRDAYEQLRKLDPFRP